MTLEKRDPIPRGYYWLDVFGDNIQPLDAKTFVFEQWIALHSVQNHVRLVKSDDVIETRFVSSAKVGKWYLFEVTAPVPRWPQASNLGYPTIASRGANTSQADIAQKPLPESYKTPFETFLTSFTGVVKWGLLGAGTYVAYKVLVKK